MALIEIVLKEAATCLGCGRRIAVGDVAYEDDEMEQIWCKRCFDETMAEIEAEEAAEAAKYGEALPPTEKVVEVVPPPVLRTSAKQTAAPRDDFKAPTVKAKVSKAPPLVIEAPKKGSAAAAAPPAGQAAAEASPATPKGAAPAGDSLTVPEVNKPATRVSSGGTVVSSMGGRSQRPALDSTGFPEPSFAAPKVGAAPKAKAAVATTKAGTASKVAPAAPKAAPKSTAKAPSKAEVQPTPAKAAASVQKAAPPKGAPPLPPVAPAAPAEKAAPESAAPKAAPKAPVAPRKSRARAQSAASAPASTAPAAPAPPAPAAPAAPVAPAATAPPAKKAAPAPSAPRGARTSVRGGAEGGSRAKRESARPAAETPAKAASKRRSEHEAPPPRAKRSAHEAPPPRTGRSEHEAPPPRAEHHNLSDLVGELQDTGGTYRLGKSQVREEDMASYPPLGVAPVVPDFAKGAALEHEGTQDQGIAGAEAEVGTLAVGVTADPNSGFLPPDVVPEMQSGYLGAAYTPPEPIMDEGVGADSPSRNRQYTAPESNLQGGDRVLQDLWNRYHMYMATNLRADMVEGMASIDDRRRWMPISGDMEHVISQGEAVLEFGPEIEAVTARLGEDQTLVYGWPSVVVDTTEGLQIAPLLVVNISQPPYTNYQAQVTSEPVINPAILRVIWSHSSDVNFLRDAFGNEVPKGAVAISKFVQHICNVMGLKVYDLDPLKLIHRTPDETGVYNIASLMVTNITHDAKTTIEELQKIAQAGDWHSSASASLFGETLTPVSEGRDTTPVMPWSADQNFEDSLQLIRTKPLTVFNMTKRDTIDQLITSAAANAWIDNESLLVLSDDTKRLDTIVDLSWDVHSALLMRACVDSDLKANAKRKCHPLSEVAKTLLDEVQTASSSIRQIIERAYADLEKVEENRKIALEGAAVRKQWSDKKIQWESQRVEIAKRIWKQGLYPHGTDPAEIGPMAKSLAKSWMLKGMRGSMFLRGIGAKSDANLQDVIDWANMSLHIKQAEAEIAKVNDPDKYNIGAVNYRWAASSIGAVSARVSGALPGCKRFLEQLMQVKGRDAQTKKICTSLVPHLRAWAADIYNAQDFFDLSACMFDLLIVDNSNHINLAWLLPWTYRAKRLVVIGNPNGVPPSIFVDEAQLNRSAQSFGFDRGDLIGRSLEYGVTTVFNAFNNA